MWGKSNADILIKFIRERGVSDEMARSALAIAVLAQGDEQQFFKQMELLRQPSHYLDSEILSEILSLATPSQLAKVLWGPVGLKLSPIQFEKSYQRILVSRPVIRTLYELIGAAVDFLLLNPHAFTLRRSEALRLIRSKNTNWRIVGMKALRYCDIPVHEHVEWVLRFLQARNESEREIGLYELGELLEQGEPALFKSVRRSQVENLCCVLRKLTKHPNRAKRRTARVRLETLAEISRAASSSVGI